MFTDAKLSLKDSLQLGYMTSLLLLTFSYQLTAYSVSYSRIPNLVGVCDIYIYTVYKLYI